MAKNDTLMFVIFLSIAGICFYKWILIHVKMKNMILIKCNCTDIITRTMYHKNIYEYYYVYEYKNEEYKTSDRLRYKFFLWNPRIKDELDMYVFEKNPNITISPWNTYLYKLYFIVMCACIIIPFIIYMIK